MWVLMITTLRGLYIHSLTGWRMEGGAKTTWHCSRRSDSWDPRSGQKPQHRQLSLGWMGRGRWMGWPAHLVIQNHREEKEGDEEYIIKAVAEEQQGHWTMWEGSKPGVGEVKVQIPPVGDQGPCSWWMEGGEWKQIWAGISTSQWSSALLHCNHPMGGSDGRIPWKEEDKVHYIAKCICSPA